MAARVTPTVAVQLVANIAQFGSALNKAGSDLNKFKNTISGVANVIGLAFGGREIVNFTVESAKLAGQAEAVGKAFNRLSESKTLMSELTTVTGGTVSQLKLMQTAVQASNFGIAIKELPKLLEFATLRAQQTGQSVEYLTQSIILGIGRRSPMILDNLGISLGRLREKLKGVGAESASVAHMTKIVGEIAEEELGKMPGFANNAATAVERLAASFENLKVKIGGLGFIQRIFDSMATGMDQLSGDPLTKVIDTLERFNKVEGYGYTRGTTIDDIKNQIRTLIEENGGLESSQKMIEERFGISSTRAKEYADILNGLNQEYKTAKILRETLARGPVDPLTGMAEGGQPWTGRPQVVKTDEELKAEQKAIDDHLKMLSEAFKRYGTSVRILNNATKEDLQKFENYHNKAYIHSIKIWKQLGDNFTKFGEQYKTSLQELQDITKSNALSIYIPDLIGRPEDFEKATNQFKALSIGVKEDLNSINDAFANAAKGGLNDFFIGFEQISAKQITFGENILNAISSFMRSFGQQLIQLGIGKLKLDSLLTSIGIPNPAVAFAAIAAGTALMAASGAIRAQGNLAVQRTVRTTGDRGSMAGVTTRSFGAMDVRVSGTLVGNGRDLVAVINNTNFDNIYRKGG